MFLNFNKFERLVKKWTCLYRIVLKAPAEPIRSHCHISSFKIAVGPGGVYLPKWYDLLRMYQDLYSKCQGMRLWDALL